MTTALPRVRYGVGGGAPPASSELLTVDSSGAATYVTGHPWPMQPPFDEIGTYAGPVGTDDADELTELLHRLRGRGGEISAAPGYADAGLESLTVDWGDEQLDVVWSPPRRPQPLDGVAIALRRLVAGLRDHPVSVLRAVRDDGCLRLENRGAEAFTLHRLAADALAELWIGSESAGGPPELYVGEPVAVDAPEAAGELVIGAGAAVIAVAPAPLPEGPDGLLRVAWTAHGAGSLAGVQPGWLLLR